MDRPRTTDDDATAARQALAAGDPQAAIAWALLAIAGDLAELRRLERKRRS